MPSLSRPDDVGKGQMYLENSKNYTLRWLDRIDHQTMRASVEMIT